MNEVTTPMIPLVSGGWGVWLLYRVITASVQKNVGFILMKKTDKVNKRIHLINSQGKNVYLYTEYIFILLVYILLNSVYPK